MQTMKTKRMEAKAEQYRIMGRKAEQRGVAAHDCPYTGRKRNWWLEGHSGAPKKKPIPKMAWWAISATVAVVLILSVAAIAGA